MGELKQLSGQDNSFLEIEKLGLPQHIASVAIYDQSSAPGGIVRFKQIMQTFQERAHLAPYTRQRLLEVPFNADFPYWDSATTCMSFAAMWMTARKYLENWMVWLVVDVIATAIYTLKGIHFYAILYGVYLGMAIMGWRAWQLSLLQRTDPAPSA